MCVRVFVTGLCTEHGVKYTVYLISVTKQYCDRDESERWDVCRRYSDFHDFHMLLQEKVTTFVTVQFSCFDEINTIGSSENFSHNL